VGNWPEQKLQKSECEGLPGGYNLWDPLGGWRKRIAAIQLFPKGGEGATEGKGHWLFTPFNGVEAKTESIPALKGQKGGGKSRA